MDIPAKSGDRSFRIFTWQVEDEKGNRPKPFQKDIPVYELKDKTAFEPDMNMAPTPTRSVGCALYYNTIETKTEKGAAHCCLIRWGRDGKTDFVFS